jgi:hypothetical protein
MNLKNDAVPIGKNVIIHSVRIYIKERRSAMTCGRKGCKMKRSRKAPARRKAAKKKKR